MRNESSKQRLLPPSLRRRLWTLKPSPTIMHYLSALTTMLAVGLSFSQILGAQAFKDGASGSAGLIPFPEGMMTLSSSTTLNYLYFHLRHRYNFWVEK